MRKPLPFSNSSRFTLRNRKMMTLGCLSWPLRRRHQMPSSTDVAVRTDLNRQLFEAMQRHSSQIDWSWADTPTDSSALANFGMQDLSPATEVGDG